MTNKEKDELMRGIKGEKKVKCPFCNHTKFYRSAIESPCLIEIWEDEEGNTRDEDIGMCQTDYTYKCAKCNKKIKYLN